MHPAPLQRPLYGSARRPGCAPQPEHRTSSAAWLQGVLAMFEAEGLDVPALLHDAGFDPASVRHQNARFPVDEITLLWQHAVARAGRPTLGLDRMLAATHSRIGTVGHAMACSADLGEALQCLARYMAVISDATAFSLAADARGCWLVMDHTGGSLPIPRQRVEYALLTVLMQCRWLTRRELEPLAMEFVHPAPADDRRHREAFGCTPRFGAQANRMLLAAADLALPLPTHQHELGQMQAQLLDTQLERLGQTTTSTLVCAEIARRLPQGEPRRQDVAQGLGLAERTLQRRLQAESVSFQALLERTRSELARQYLAQARYSLTEVADLLGFVDTSNFFRACRRWFGMPPAQYRAQLWESEAAAAPLN
ncbi:AraC family transcriptional regulator [Xenophilus arseniciresistens]|uniref:AraC family transcriptional regulator n=1 Tax=Xenophilus arseniciresistens TaxID=1283306 RepID=A0AAE3NAN6_9BURK|nr:AraC family transcriptional regulator [Xenophilus arseniciresistens]MDA7418038.1 AraC family transcriptional regulator [Xenophilus arseniciresistens]